jgi:F420-0:gamma-glutamyl ligase
MTSIEVIALQNLPSIRAGDDLVELIASAFRRNGVTPRAGDVLVVAQKIVSNAEGRVVDLMTIEPSPQAVALAADVDKDPRLVEVILSESVRVVRARLMGRADEALPAVLVRGLRWSAPESMAASIIRSPHEDLFR